MTRIFDVIEYPNEMRDEIVHRFPETGSGNFRIGSQLIVRESQTAVFFRDGNALDVFGPGRHTITTANIPLLIDLDRQAVQRPHPLPGGSVTSFRCASSPTASGAPRSRSSCATPTWAWAWRCCRASARYSFQVKDPQQFVTQIVGAQGVYRTTDIESRLRSMLLSKLQDLLGETAAKHSVPELIGLTEELGAGVRAKAQDDFLALGLTLKTFYIENLKPSSKSAEELRAMGMLDMQTYTQLQAADAHARCSPEPQRRGRPDGRHRRRDGHRQRDRPVAGGHDRRGRKWGGAAPSQSPAPTGGAPTGGVPAAASRR